jgi:preprotein translocase subunit SecG
MLVLAAVDGLHYLFMIPLIFLSIFLMLVILVQRGRGGGLTGALGGMGGQSAFGTKAGDLFTRITIVVAAIWVLLALAAVKFLNVEGSRGGLNAAERGTVTLPATKSDVPPPPGKSGDAKAPAGDAEKSAPPADAVPSTAPAGKSAPPASAVPADATPKSSDDANP